MFIKRKSSPQISAENAAKICTSKPNIQTNTAGNKFSLFTEDENDVDNETIR